MERFVGKNVLCLSQTSHYWLGRVTSVDATHLYLEDASWIADLGRHHAALGTGKPDDHAEVEPHPDGSVMAVPIQGTVVIDWRHDLWRAVK